MTHWLLVDTTYLCHRARHAMDGAALTTPDGKRVEVIFNLLDTVGHLLDRFPKAVPLFCFDLGQGVRLASMPGYKGNRRKRLAAMSQGEQDEYAVFQKQMHELRRRVLPDVGYSVYADRGFEADDLIAALALVVCDTPRDRATIVGSDGDLWQCLASSVRVYNPQTRKILTRQAFVAKWGLEPPLWANVKALAGCTSDDVPGIAGVGELTAARWFTNQLKPTSRGYKLIDENIGVMATNLPTVRLPHADTPQQVLRRGQATPAQWRQVCDTYGLPTLRGQYPGSHRPRGVKSRKTKAGGLGV